MFVFTYSSLYFLISNDDNLERMYTIHDFKNSVESQHFHHHHYYYRHRHRHIHCPKRATKNQRHHQRLTYRCECVSRPTAPWPKRKDSKRQICIPTNKSKFFRFNRLLILLLALPFYHSIRICVPRQRLMRRVLDMHLMAWSRARGEVRNTLFG